MKADKRTAEPCLRPRRPRRLDRRKVEADAITLEQFYNLLDTINRAMRNTDEIDAALAACSRGAAMAEELGFDGIAQGLRRALRITSAWMA